MSGESNGVSYSVKELLSKIEGKIDGVILTIGQKADKHEVEQLASRVNVLEAEARGGRELREFVRWLIPVLAVIAAVVIAHYINR